MTDKIEDMTKEVLIQYGRASASFIAKATNITYGTIAKHLKEMQKSGDVGTGVDENGKLYYYLRR